MEKLIPISILINESYSLMTLKIENETEKQKKERIKRHKKLVSRWHKRLMKK